MRDHACILALNENGFQFESSVDDGRTITERPAHRRISRRAKSSIPRVTCCARWPRRSASRSSSQLRESARCVHELVDALAVPQPLVSQHLRILKAAGVVAGERSGREVLYRLVDHHLADIVLAAVAHAGE